MKITLTKHDQISLELHRLVKKELRVNPDIVIAHAQSNLKRWKEQNDEGYYWMKEWHALLLQGVEAVAPILDGLDQKSTLLRSSSPFTGIVSQTDRMAILEKFKSMKKE